MSYTTPTTRATGNTISAANWNTDLVDNVKWVAGDSGGKPHCRVYNSASISIANNTPTVLTMDSESWDSGGMHSTSVNTSRLTVPSGGGGKYVIGGGVNFPANATGTRWAAILLNGTTVLAKVETPGNASIDANLNPSTVYVLNATDYVELYVYQSSGGNLNAARQASWSPEFWAMWTAL